MQARLAVCLLVASLFAPGVVSAVTYDPTVNADLHPGTIERPDANATVISVQGFHFRGKGSTKKPPRLVSVAGNGTLRWQYDGRATGTAWFYDVDPLPDGNLLVTSIKPGYTLVYELDPETRQRRWSERFDIEDTHDVDMLDNGDLLVANMRQWNGNASRSDDRVFVYNRTTDEVVWEWSFRKHFPNDTDGGMNPDWTHVNDVEAVGNDTFLVSARNFDQVLLVNRTTKEIEWRLGRDDAYGTLNEQHNPDYLVSENGTPTILVADSENDRVVEYARRDGEWVQTWEVGSKHLNWPRDADRLPNGNTLITDTLHHRVVEVTPRGKVVWEYYATWGPYEAERLGTGDESNGPTMADVGAEGSYSLHGSAHLEPAGVTTYSPAQWATDTFASTPLAGPVDAVAARWAHVTPWLRPVWLSGWDLLWALLGGLVLAGWLLVELYLGRGAIRARLRLRRA
ncbi:MAG: aryl-sulfate sulfotransferase [Haloferacaceae archaeon]